MTKPRSILSDDDVLGDLLSWHDAGLKTVLVTLVAIEGTTPRPLGAQMAVAETGEYTGYLSGGCIEQSVAREALSALKDGTNKLVRYGKGSAYFDLKLPCGSGLDLYFDRGLDAGILCDVAAHRNARRPFIMSTDLDSGISAIRPDGVTASCRRDGTIFHRLHLPLPRTLLIGGGPALAAIARLFSASGMEIEILTPDGDVRSALLNMGFRVHQLTAAAPATLPALDRWTATVVAFHEHAWEARILAEILKSDSFYIGVMGGKKAHQDRIIQLSALGVSDGTLQRLRSPAGLIPGAKSRATLAAGMFAEVMAEAKLAGLLP